MLDAISPIDGRYANKTAELAEFFSEAGLIRYRIRVEVAYFLHLSDLGIIKLNSESKKAIIARTRSMGHQDISRVKEIEQTTNHDVKAVEYFLKEILADLVDQNYLEFIHFGLTSQDINNTALPMMVRDAVDRILLPTLDDLAGVLSDTSGRYTDLPMLARTHGQPASPTTLGKELRVFSERLEMQIKPLRSWTYYAKFGGATGNFNAHLVAFPHTDWTEAADQLIAGLGLERYQTTTQIAHYDDLAALFHQYIRIAVVLIDCCRDVWTYISMNYFVQKVVAEEVGSSAMPHKVNPIDFENAEGNLSISVALFEFLASKLPVSRLQRDLTDSTVSRNIGVPFAHLLIALKSMMRGFSKLDVNPAVIRADLQSNWAVVAEGIQTILRREGHPHPYEALKAFSRGKGALSESDFEAFIDQLDIPEEIKDELRNITPFNYTGTSTATK